MISVSIKTDSVSVDFTILCDKLDANPKNNKFNKTKETTIYNDFFDTKILFNKFTAKVRRKF